MVKCRRMKRLQFTSSGSTVKNHISLKIVFEYNTIRKISYWLWFLVYLQLLEAGPPLHPRLLQVSIDHADHHPAIESSESVDRQAWECPFTSATSEELLHKPNKIPKPNKNEDHEQVRETRIQTYQNGCENSERILWMKEFLNTETHTRVLLMNHL